MISVKRFPAQKNKARTGLCDAPRAELLGHGVKRRPWRSEYHRGRNVINGSCATSRRR